MSTETFDGQLITGEQLMEALFTPEARPSSRWLRTQMKRGVIQPIRIGGLVFFNEAAVRRSLVANNVYPKHADYRPMARKGGKP